MDEKITTSTVAENNSDNILEVKHLKKYFSIAKKYHFVEPMKAIGVRIKRLFAKDKTAIDKPPVKFSTTTYLRAVDDITFSLPRGTTIGVVGESGCGKTTLGRTILRLYEANGGQIIFDGNEIPHGYAAGISRPVFQPSAAYDDRKYHCRSGKGTQYRT